MSHAQVLPASLATDEASPRAGVPSSTPAVEAGVLRAAEPEVVLAPQKERRLDLACGQSCREGFEGVDMFADAKHRVNLMRFPWPWADSSIDELHCSHFVEHIPMVYVSPEGEYRDVPASTGDRDLFFAFFDECWRILKPGGLMTVIVPALRSNRLPMRPLLKKAGVPLL